MSQSKELLRKMGCVPLPRFSILDEYDFISKKSKRREKFDKPRLTRLARKLNGRSEREHPDLVPIVVGHTTDEGPETGQPPVCGYGRDYQVERINGLWNITAEPWARPGSASQFRNFPRRSVEVWLGPSGTGDDDDIDPISLLGATTPRRTLGVHQFARDRGELEHFSREPGQGDCQMTDVTGQDDGAEGPTSGNSKFSPEDVEFLTAQIMKSRPMVELMGLASEIKSLLDDEGSEHMDDGMSGGAASAAPPGFGGAGAAAAPPVAPPGGGGGAMPAMEKEQMSRIADAAVEKFKREVYEPMRTSLEREKSSIELRGNLEKLSRTIDLDVEAELADMLVMDKKQQASHVQRITTRYAKKRLTPNGGKPLHGDTDDAPLRMSRKSAGVDDVQHEAIESLDPFRLAQHATATGKSLGEAAVELASKAKSEVISVR